MHLPEKAKVIKLGERPKGLPDKDTFIYESVPLSSPEKGQVTVKADIISVDPYMRGRMNDTKSYTAPYAVGEPITGGVIAKVVASASDQFNEGDHVLGNLGWATYQTVSDQNIRKIDPEAAPISAYLGVLGMTGLTAYFGLLDIGAPKPGETVVVSGAAGAVGSAVGQIAKIKEARAVGIAGSQEKIDYLKNELKFDEAVNYKSESFKDDLAAAVQDGVDVYFDNVGGKVSDEVLKHLNSGARIPVCGQISVYNDEKPDLAPRVQPLLIINKAKMQGFIVGDYQDHFPEGMKNLSKWVKNGDIKYRETFIEGFDNVPDAFIGLFQGENIGKYLVKIED